ncbi:hypothetical protein [Ensifer aridi]|uniref:hypothetical protein n=1 Tax=Ensifer aridi TaxID=1708715 RepID=UPI00111C5D76|nr:hypothetical protein [Ensifer aridi]
MQQQQALQNSADIQQHATRQVVKAAKLTGDPQAALLEFAQSPLGNQFLVAGGDWNRLGEAALAAVAPQEARRRAEILEEATEAPTQEPAVAGEAPQVPKRTYTSEMYLRAAHQYFANGDEKGAETALRLAQEKRELEKQLEPPTTDDMREYNFYVEQRRAAGVPEEDIPEFLEFLLMQKRASAQNITIGGEIETALEKELGKFQGENLGKISEQGRKAASLKPAFDLLDQLLPLAPQGRLIDQNIDLSRWIGKIQGLSSHTSVGEAVNAMVAYIQPQLRQEGSGNQSDADVELAGRALPQLPNQPEANRFIVEVWKRKVALDMQRADIVRQITFKEITPAKGFRMLSELDEQSILTPDVRQAIEGIISAEIEGRGLGSRAKSPAPAVPERPFGFMPEPAAPRPQGGSGFRTGPRR